MKRISTTVTHDRVRELLKSGKEIEVELTADELKVVPNVKMVRRLTYKLWCDTEFDHDLPDCIKMSVHAELELLDDHTFKLVPFTATDQEDIILRSEDKENCVEKEGNEYDLRPSLLAVFFSLVPTSYSIAPLKKIETDDCIIYSQEEYEKTRRSNNPFSDIDPEDFN